jgi:hypothetical protein
MKRIALLAALLLAAPAGDLFACNTCYGDASGPMIDGARLGIWLLLGVTLLVQGAFVAFFLYLRRQARRVADQSIDAEWARLQQEFATGHRTLEHP